MGENEGIYCDSSEVKCLWCGHIRQDDNYYNRRAGDELHCPRCENVTHVVQVYVLYEYLLSKTAE
ncbi:MAG: hypothetical protein K2X93_06795 [Candidatus Obscuribacterales bacterium]|nr:hypothetical protein [Candidatus Obscuribacterales bacterium]